MPRPDWHYCGRCYWFHPGDKEDWCNRGMEAIGTYDERPGCFFWMCDSCMGEWDGEEAHGDCMVIEVELEE